MGIVVAQPAQLLAYFEGDTHAMMRLMTPNDTTTTMRCRIGYCMHSRTPLRQHDALSVQTDVQKSRNLHPKEVQVDADVLSALADGVAASPNAQLAGRFVLSELPRVLQQHALGCQDGLMNGRHVRETHARLCANLRTDLRCTAFQHDRGGTYQRRSRRRPEYRDSRACLPLFV